MTTPLPLVKNPYRLLRAAGLDDMQKVVEVGCGPGFFTIPAVRIVGEKGHVYAIDVNHKALKRVWKSWITNKWFWAGFFRESAGTDSLFGAHPP